MARPHLQLHRPPHSLGHTLAYPPQRQLSEVSPKEMARVLIASSPGRSPSAAPRPLTPEVKRITEPVALSSAVSTDRSSWALRPSASGLWRRPRLTRAPYSVTGATLQQLDPSAPKEASRRTRKPRKPVLGRNP
jgi:hypothetical protein